MQMRLLLLTGIILTLCGCGKEVETEADPLEDVTEEIPIQYAHGYGSFSLSTNDAEGRNIMTFSNRDSLGNYHQLKLTISKDTSTNYFESELLKFEAIWKASQDSLQVDLDYVFVDYPLKYDDILKNQIEAFVQDSSWQDTRDEAQLDFMKIRAVMKDKNVYAPLNHWLQAKGYKIARLLTEKHGFVEPKDLKRLGYSGKEAIPVPFLVWIEVADIN